MKTYNYPCALSGLKNYVYLVIVMLFSYPVQAQLSNYYFTQKRSTYVPLNGGTLIGYSTSADPGNTSNKEVLVNHTFPNIPLPFVYRFNNTDYTAVHINTNGWVSFGGDTGSTTIPFTLPMFKDVIVANSNNGLMGINGITGTLTNGSAIITNVSTTEHCRVGTTIRGSGIPLGTTIVSFTPSSITLSTAATRSFSNVYVAIASGEIRTDTFGTAPNRIFVIQYSGFALYSAAAFSDTNNSSCEFQIQLYENSGSQAGPQIDIIYGKWFRASGISTLYVGIKGQTNQQLQNLDSDVKRWYPVASTTNSSYLLWDTVSRPLSGLVYTWSFLGCYPATGLSIPLASITQTGATFDWKKPLVLPDSVVRYEWEVRSSGQPGSGPAGLAASGNTTGTSAGTNVLTPGTHYQVYVRSVCSGVNGDSPWSAGMAFTTLCSVFGYQFSQGFNEGKLPLCWENKNDLNSTNPLNLWQFSGSPAYMAKLNGRTSGAYAWVSGNPILDVDTFYLTSPKIDLTGWLSPSIFFDYFSDNNNSPRIPNNIFMVAVNNGSGWEELYTNSFSEPGWRHMEVPFPSKYVNTIVQIRFSVKLADRLSAPNNDILLDSVFVREGANCQPPDPVYVKCIDPDRAVLNWIAPIRANAVNYEWEVRTKSTAPGSGSIGLAAAGLTLNAGLTDTAKGLEPNKDYNVFVRSVCSGSELSRWSRIATFVTMTSLPWTERFRFGKFSYLEMQDAFFDWTEAFWPFVAFADTSSGWEVNTKGGLMGNSGACINRRCNTGKLQKELKTCQIGILGPEDILSFNYKAANFAFPYTPAPLGSGSFVVAVSTDNGASYVPLDTVPNNGEDNWRYKGYALSAFSGKAVRIKIIPIRDSGDYHLGLDDFYIGPCPHSEVQLGNDTVVCASVSGFELDVASKDPYAGYVWDNGSRLPKRNIQESGTYFVTVNSGLCFGVDTINIVMQPSPVLDLGTDTALCDGFSLQLDAGNANAILEWENGSATQMRTIDQAGLYYVTATGTNGCSSRDSIYVRLLPKPAGKVHIKDAGAQTYIFSLDRAQEVKTVLWDFGDGNTGSGMSVLHAYAVAGNYKVTVMLIGICEDTVRMEQKWTAGTLSSPDLVGDSSLVVLYPNPSTNSVHIYNKGMLKVKRWSVYNIQGQLIHTESFLKFSDTPLDVSGYASGSYTLIIETEKGSVIRKFEVLH